ncbi:MAG: sugar transferase [Chloroflexota bacterium]|nr:sugar transferase [Chloroflexota bacterium]
MARVEEAAAPHVASRRAGWRPSRPDAASSVPATYPLDRMLTLCARRTLSDRDRAAMLEVGASLDAAAWREVGARARVNGLEGLLLEHLTAVGLLDQAPTDLVSALLGNYRAAWIGNRRLRGMLAVILEALAARGVEAIAVKGVALALRYYGEPALRPAGDIDLLVRREDIPICADALESLGCHPHLGMGNPREFYPLFFRTLVYQFSADVTIELHWELTNLPLYLPRLRASEELWARAERIEIAGQPARYLAPADELRYLALHAVVQHGDVQRAIWLVDIAELVRNLPPDWDWDAFAAETANLGLASPTLAALLAAWRYGSLPVPRQALEALRRATTSREERRAWERSFGRDAGVRLPDAAMRHLRAQDTLADRLTLFWRLAGRAQRRWLRQAQLAANRLMQDRLRWRQASQSMASAPISAIGPARQAGEQALPTVFYSSGELPAVLTPAPARVAAPGQSRRGYRMAKRALDIVVAALLLALVSPLLLLVACLVKLDGGPVIYTRELVGQRERAFRMLKFRTMRADADALLQTDVLLFAEYQEHFKLQHDPRITRIGYWLRRFSIDELPQLWNVLRGEMSLVGPRPVHAIEAPVFGGFFAERQSVPPGITGLWQISGRSTTTYERRIELDRAYVRTRSLRGDLGILLRTLPVVVRGSGAY